MRAVVRSPYVREVADTAARAAEERLVNAKDAEITAAMMENLGPVLVALQPTKDAVVRLGSILVVKVDWAIAVHQLSPAQQFRLAHEKHLATSPQEIVAALATRMRESADEEPIDGNVSATLTEPKSESLNVVRRPNR